MNNETIILGKKYICQPIGLKQKSGWRSNQ